MTDDLVKLLREEAAQWAHPNTTIEKQAADRIEEHEQQIEGLASVIQELLDKDKDARIQKLEKALLEISSAVGDPSAYWIARAALEEKTDD